MIGPGKVRTWFFLDPAQPRVSQKKRSASLLCHSPFNRNEHAQAAHRDAGYNPEKWSDTGSGEVLPESMHEGRPL